MKKTKCVLIYHSPLEKDAPADELDVLKEAELVAQGLQALGYEVAKKPFPIDFEHLRQELNEINPVFVFNLVESIRNDGRLICMAPLMLEHFRMPYAACKSDAIYLTSNKLLAKQVMMLAGIPTPSYVTPDNHMISEASHDPAFMIKSVWEHASYGMDEHLIKLRNGKELKGFFGSLRKGEQAYFAEQYIDGREFNVSLLGAKEDPVILPLAEIEFRNYPDKKLKIVGYRAKWDEASFEYKHTCRVFMEDEPDLAVFAKIREISLKCWKVFGLSGYARVDFRIDKNNNAWVLEVNTNPCISPDSGFIAAARQAGMTVEGVIERIICDVS